MAKRQEKGAYIFSTTLDAIFLQIMLDPKSVVTLKQTKIFAGTQEK
jgi:hypothetical protein